MSEFKSCPHCGAEFKTNRLVVCPMCDKALDKAIAKPESDKKAIKPGKKIKFN